MTSSKMTPFSKNKAVSPSSPKNCPPCPLLATIPCASSTPATSTTTKVATSSTPWTLALSILFGFPFYLFKKFVAHKMYRVGVYGFACAAVIGSNRWLKVVKMYEKHLENDGVNEI